MTQNSDLDLETLRKLRHDIRSPLLIINGFAQLLASGREMTVEERRDYAERIQAAAAELRRLIEETVG
jgi:signal transduction histidine kinase